MLNLSALLDHPGKHFPDRTAVIFNGASISYGDLNAMACRVANYLGSCGVEKGDRVALTCPNLPHFPAVYFGILKAGAIVVPLNVMLKDREIAYHLADCGAKVYFCFEAMAADGTAAFGEVDSCNKFALLRGDLSEFFQDQPSTFATLQTAPEDSAVILYTSGTTGQPKGAELSHSNLVLNAFLGQDLVHYSRDDVGLVVLPLFHSFGQSVLMNAMFLAGASFVLQARFEPAESLRLMDEHAVTVFAGVPTMYWALKNSAETASQHVQVVQKNLRVCISGGSAMPVELLREFEKVFTASILEGYGLSETSPVVSFNHLDTERKPGSVGTPVWGVEMCVMDKQDQPLGDGEVGEVCVRGHNVMKGYYGRPKETAEALRGGWLHTGDLGVRDEDGYYRIVDRSKDMIIRGGYNIYPRELEEVLITHPAVSLAAVIGVPQEKEGEEVKAFIVRSEGSKLSEDELVTWCKEEMAAYKYPRLIEFRDQLPMTATGKILKRALKEDS